ncbi:MAG: hypothetical protein R2852_07815 [Bacteroidia bacterium]
MDFYFPEHEKREYATLESLKEIRSLEIPLTKVVEYVEKLKPHVSYIDKKLSGNPRLETVFNLLIVRFLQLISSSSK